MSKKNILLFLVLAILASVGYYYANKPTSTLKAGLTNFAVKDTTAIQKITISDLRENHVELVRKDNYWTLNNEFVAKQDNIDLILETLYRLQVQGPVSKTARENIIKRLSANHRMVQIYMDDMEEPVKTIYIGDATINHMGTYALLETKEDGRSQEPFIIEDYSAKGYLTPRFFATFDEWKSTKLFRYPNLALDKIEVTFTEDAANSFSIEYFGNNEVKVFDKDYNPIFNIDSVRVKDYIQRFKKVHFEAFVKDPNNNAIRDSITAAAPQYEIKVFPKGKAQPEFIQLWIKDVGIEQQDAFGNPQDYDVDRMWGLDHNGNFVFAQYYVFDRLLIPLNHFIKK